MGAWNAVVCCAQYTVVMPAIVSAVPGSCAQIPCTFHHSAFTPKPRGKWIKRGRNTRDTIIYDSTYPYGQRYNYGGRAELKGNLAKGQCSLLLKNIRKRDQGTYYFSVQGHWGWIITTYKTVRSEVFLSVSDKPRISGHGELTSGKAAGLTCSITHSCPYDRLQLRWIDYNGSLPLPWDTKDGPEIVDERSGSWRVSSVLTFTPSSAIHGKSLGCSILLHGSPTSSPQILTLEIKYGLENPTVNSSMVAVEGSSLLLYCTAWGKPAVSLRWVKNGDEISTSSTNELKRTFHNISLEDDGEYWCVAENDLGTANSSTRISVQYKPTIVSGPTCNSSEKWTGCNCSVTANPPANITWGLNGSIITGNRSDMKVISWAVNSYLVQSSLTLTHPTGTGTGTGIQISCVAANVHGDCVSKYQLHSMGIFLFSWTEIFKIGGGACGLIIVIAVVVMVKVQRKKQSEAVRASETPDNSVIYAVVQNARNAQSDVQYPEAGLEALISTKPAHKEEVLYASIDISKFRKQERYIQNEETCEYATIKHN
ncbi:sialic acid-binding Ig-like lectin 13 isoform X2 [Heptranchias perlo]|uniref:sialic acid-binding Ig-like lectin 13 isoform X2 n=1 Tax=Heptranchias perlo TaxID=212740 RepID=UPI0035599435